MAEVTPKDILLRVGCTPHGVLVVGGARRVVGSLAPAYTLSRGSVRRFRARDGIGRKAAADKIAIEYPAGLVDQFGNPLGGPLIHEARTQLVTDPENFANWTETGLVGLSGGQADPFGGTAAYLFDSNTPSASDARFQVVTFTGDATKAMRVFMRTFSGVQARFGIFDLTAGVFRHAVNVNWSGGVPSLATAFGSGDLFPVEPMAGGWSALAINAIGVIAANTNRIYLYPDNTGGGSANYFFGANAWNAIYPSSYQGPGESAGVGEGLSVPVNFGRIVCSLYFDIIERTVHDASTDNRIVTIGAGTFTAPYLAIQGTGTSGYRAIFDNGAGIVFSGFLSFGAFGDRVRGVARLYSDGSVELERRINEGASATSSRSAASALTAGPWSAQTLWCNGGNGYVTSAGQRVFLNGMVIRGTHTLAEAIAAA